MTKIHHNTAKKARAHKIDLIVEDNEIVASKSGVRLASGLQGNKVLEDAIAKLIAQHPANQKIQAVKVAKLAPAAKPAKAPKAPKAKPSAAELAATEEGWKALRGGGFIKKEEGEESENSEAASWTELCEEQGIEVESEGGSIIKSKYKAIYNQSAVKGTCGDDLAARLREYLMVDTEEGPRVDKKLMKRFAEANGCWIAAYGSMKNGLVRMNVVNRLRAKVRKAAKAGEKFEIEWVD